MQAHDGQGEAEMVGDVGVAALRAPRNRTSRAIVDAATEVFRQDAVSEQDAVPILQKRATARHGGRRRVHPDAELLGRRQATMTSSEKLLLLKIRRIVHGRMPSGLCKPRRSFWNGIKYPRIRFGGVKAEEI